jgi:hypothetical protein
MLADFQRFTIFPVKTLIVLACVTSPLAGQSYRQWALEQGVGDQTADSDLDEDGSSNFLEYALGSSPHHFNQDASWSDTVKVRYAKGPMAKLAGNTLWQIQVSETMEPDSWVAAVPDFENSDSLEISLAEHAEMAPAKKVFTRLAVSRAIHPVALNYASATGLTGNPVQEVSHVLYELEDAGIEPDFLFLPGSRYRSRSGSLVHAVIGGTGNLTGNIVDEERAMVFNGSASWIEFENPAKSEALPDYTLFAVASAASVTNQSLIASSFGGNSARGCRLMFNASSSWGASAGELWADANTGKPSSTSGWRTLTRIHSGNQFLPCSVTYSSQTVLPKGDLAAPSPSARFTVSAGVTRASAASVALENTLWNGSAKFRIGANLTGGAYHQGKIAMVLVTRTATFEESVFQRLATTPIRAGLVSRYGPEVFAVFDGDSVTEGAGSPGASYGKWSYVAQLFGGEAGQFPGGQWIGNFNGRNIAVGGRAIASSEVAWEHTTRHILSRSEWGARYYFGMISHNQSNMGSEANLARVEELWKKAKRLGAHPVCVGLLSGQKGGAAHEAAYQAVKDRAHLNGVSFVDAGSISQLKAGAFPSGADSFYLDVIHPTEKGYRLITQEIAATLELPGSQAPRSLGKPTVIGPPIVGQNLVCDSGLWEKSPTRIAYQWMRNATDISGANSEIYLIHPADLGAKISCRVTAFNEAGAAERTSAHTDVVNQF